ncbi:MAG: hypothetical protein IIU10_05870, partial [Paludibacteraceae bacterium]|nr:hypothetical protein [Paludibacteraceae bacterium]
AEANAGRAAQAREETDEEGEESCSRSAARGERANAGANANAGRAAQAREEADEEGEESCSGSAGRGKRG